MDHASPAKSTVKQYLAQPAVQQRVKELLGRRADQFMTSVTAMVNADDKLATCEPVSLFMACLTAAALDLPVNKNLSFAHIVPYENRKVGVTEAQFQMGWKGFVQLAQRSGLYNTLNTSDVREGEITTRDRLSGEITFQWCEDDEEREKLPVVGYVAFFKLSSGFNKTLYMSTKELVLHATRYSKAYAYDLKAHKHISPWSTNFDAMCLKTVVKLLISKWGPMSVEMRKAVEADYGVIHDDETITYIDSMTVNPEDLDATEEKKQKILEAQTKKMREDVDKIFKAKNDTDS